MAEPVRLAKQVAALAGCSRRDAELLVQGGWVRVDGAVVEEPQHRVGPEQRVAIEAGARPQPIEPVTVLLHQPPGATVEDARALLTPGNHVGPPSMRILRCHFAHLTPLLPLPAGAGGLAVFSQQRGVIRRLTEDLLEQEVLADVAGDAAPDALARLGRGLVHEGRSLPPLKVSWQSERRLRFALKGVAPELVPWMCEQVGLRVTALKRIRIGRLPLAGLAPGQWRYLGAAEKF